MVDGVIRHGSRPLPFNFHHEFPIVELLKKVDHRLPVPQSRSPRYFDINDCDSLVNRRIRRSRSSNIRLRPPKGCNSPQNRDSQSRLRLQKLRVLRRECVAETGCSFYFFRRLINWAMSISKADCIAKLWNIPFKTQVGHQSRFQPVWGRTQFHTSQQGDLVRHQRLRRRWGGQV